MAHLSCRTSVFLAVVVTSWQEEAAQLVSPWQEAVEVPVVVALPCEETAEVVAQAEALSSFEVALAEAAVLVEAAEKPVMP